MLKNFTPTINQKTAYFWLFFYFKITLIFLLNNIPSPQPSPKPRVALALAVAQGEGDRRLS